MEKDELLGDGLEINPDLAGDDISKKVGADKCMNKANRKISNPLDVAPNSQKAMDYLNVPKKCDQKDCVLHHHQGKVQQYSSSNFMRKRVHY